MTFIKSLIFKIVALVLFLLVVVAASFNSDPVSLVFLEWRTPEMAVSVWMLAAFLVGIVCTSVYNIWANTRLRLVARKANKSVDKAHKDLDKLKAEAAEVESKALAPTPALD